VKSTFDINELARAYEGGLRTRVAGVPAPDRIRRRIVLVDDDRASAERLEALLRGGGLPVWLVTEQEAEATLGQPDARPALVVAPSDPLAFVRRLRADNRLGFVHIVFIGSSGRPREVGRAFEAGVDDFIRKPWPPDEIAARLSGRFDAIAKAALLHAQAVAADVLRRDAGISLEAMGVTETNTFREAASVLERMLSEFLGQSIEVRQGLAPAPAVGAVVKLVDVEREVEIGAAVVAGVDHCAALSRVFMGEDIADESFFADVVGELANMVMATLKSSFMADGFALASGVPATYCPRRIEADMKAYPGRKVLLARGDAFEFNIMVGVRLCPPTDQPAEAIEEGMVLAQDLRDPEGEFTARQGTRVTRGLAERIRTSLTGRTVKVADVRTRAA